MVGGSQLRNPLRVPALCILNVLPTRATADPVVSALRTSNRRLGVRLSTMQYLVGLISHGEVTCYRPWTFPFVSQHLKCSQETPIITIELPDKKYPPILCQVKCPMIRPPRYSMPSNAHLGLPTTSGLRPSSFDKHTCPYVGQWSSTTHPGHFHHRIISTTFTDREQRLFSSGVIANANNHANHAPRVSPPIAHTTCRMLRPHKKCVCQHKSHPCKTEEYTPDKLCSQTPSAVNRQL